MGAKPLHGLQGYELAEVAKHSNLPVDVTQATLETLLNEGRVRKVGTLWFAQTVWEALREESVRLVSEYHRQYPLRGGLSKEEWRSRLGLPSRMAVEIFVALQQDGQLAEVTGASGSASGFIRLPGFVPTFTPAQQQQVEQLLQQFHQNPYTPPGRVEAEAMVGTEVMAVLVEQGTLVKLGSGADVVFFLHETYDEAVATLIAYLKEQGRMTASQARDLLGTTRKYILPLLEHMDERRITRRVGDERVLVPVKT
jgi:selenocysteine-specific elongation factor